MASITDLPFLMEQLPDKTQAVFKRIYDVHVTEGTVHPPPRMHQWIQKHFGSLELVKKQKIVKVTNKLTLESSLFNELRTRRPLQASKHESKEPNKTRSASRDPCPFCNPLELTPEDAFGRVKGKHCITASNIAKYDQWHSLIIFNNHDPYNFTRDMLQDYLETGEKWARRVQKVDPSAQYYFFMWNCTWRAGASVMHGHAQVTMNSHRPYSKILTLKKAADQYASQYNSNYFEDLITIHEDLNLSIHKGDTTILAYLTPIKEKEFWIIDNGEKNHGDVLHDVLRFLLDDLGVQSFNVAIYKPPLREETKNDKHWQWFPKMLIRVVDRGPLDVFTSDIGAMELYASSVVSSDPFKLMMLFKERKNP